MSSHLPLRLARMTEEDFAVWSARSVESYIQDRMRTQGHERPEAERVARGDVARLLPEGVHSRDNFLYSIRNAHDAVVGYLWFAVRGPEHGRRAYLTDFIIEEEHRGRGLGREAMRLLESEVSALGLGRIGLRVLADNAPAIALYRSLGYAATELIMEKALPR